jgi:D-3-phosphoglycerate dehydrogenase
LKEALRILVAEKSSFSERGLQAFAGLGPTEAMDLTQAELESLVSEYDLLVIRMGLQVDRAVFARGDQLKGVATATTGTDHIDLAAAENFGVAVISLKDERQFLEGVYATAEHTFALLLCLIRHIPWAFEAVKDSVWRRDRFRGSELHGKNLGIIGFGRLGTMVARYGVAFGMQVQAYDPYQSDLLEGIERCWSLPELLARSDVVSLHVPLNAETHGMLGEAELAQMRRGAILINTARGAIINEAALLRSLEAGHLGGVALDVLADEHMIGLKKRPLIEYARTHKNLIITPHIAGATYESVEKADLFLAKKVEEFFSNNLTL